MKIGIFAKICNVSQDTIRFYEKKGLIRPTQIGYYKEYTDEDVDRLALIDKLKLLGLTLEEMRQMFLWEEELERHRDDKQMQTIIMQKVYTFLIKCQKLAIQKEQQLKQTNQLLTKAIAKIQKEYGEQ